MIQLLQELAQDPEQHFHISSDFSGEPGIGDIEISVAGHTDVDNMSLFGLAIAPDTEVAGTQS